MNPRTIADREGPNINIVTRGGEKIGADARKSTSTKNPEGHPRKYQV
jgi:hypothetical protein